MKEITIFLLIAIVLTTACTVQDKRFIELGKEYDSLKIVDNSILMKEVGGKLAFGVISDGKEFVIYDSAEGKRYDTISDISDIGGKLTYVAEYINKKIVVHNSIEEKAYENVGQISDVNGKLAFTAQKDNGKWIVVYGGIEGKEYDSISQLSDIGGKLVYLVKEGGRFDAKWFVVYEGVKQKEYDEIRQISDVNGKLAFTAQKDNGKWIVVYGGIEGKEYDSISQLSDIGGKLTYVAGKGCSHINIINTGYLIGGKGCKGIVVFDGNEGKEYHSIAKVLDVGGKPAYRAWNDDKEFVVYGNIEGKYYDPINEYIIEDKTIIIDNKLAYIAKEGGTKWFIVFDGNETEVQHGIPREIVKMDNKLAYSVLLTAFPRKNAIVYNGELIGVNYKDTLRPVNIGGKLAFGALKYGQWIIVLER